MKYIKIFSAATVNKGKIRENNEDNLYINGWHLTEQNCEIPHSHVSESDDSLQIFAVCDGMGGESEGETASLTAVETLKRFQKMLQEMQYHDFNKYMEMYIAEAGNIISEISAKSENKRIGTTIAMLCCENGKIHVYNVGDSRIYRLHKKNLTQVTEDHTSLNRAISLGMIKKENAKDYPHRNKLTQYVGIPSYELKVKPFHNTIKPKNNDVYLICSDGLSDMIDENEIAKILKLEINEKEKADLLVSKALENGGRDNISVILLKFYVKNKWFGKWEVNYD